MGKAISIIRAVASIAIGIATGNPFMALSGAFSLVGGLAGGSQSSKKAYGGTQVDYGSRSFAQEASGTAQMVRASVEPRRVVYGRSKVSGPLVAAFLTNSNKTLHMFVPMATHEVDAIEDVFFDDANATSGPFNGLYTLYKYTGTTDQAASSQAIAALGSNWSADHRGRGVAYIYAQLTFNRDKWVTGVPNLSAIVKGKKVYDPRDGTQIINNSATWKWSDNPALCHLDFVRSDYGFGAADSEVDLDSYIAAANTCDELVTVDFAGTTQKRYTCNGSFQLDKPPIEINEDLLSCFAGISVFQQGKFRVYAGTIHDKAMTLTIDDLRGPIEVATSAPERDRWNGVRGTYRDPTKFWQPTDFPAVLNPTYEAEDGRQIIRDIELPFTNDSIMAQRIAKLRLERSRQSINVTYPAKLTAIKLAPWSVVGVTDSALGWDDKLFRVITVKLASNGVGVDLELQEEAAGVYDWNYGQATTVDLAPNSGLPSVFDGGAGPTGLTATETLIRSGSGQVQSVVTLNWVEPTDAFVRSYRVQYKLATATDYTTLTETIDTSATILGLNPGTYTVRVAALSTFGAISEWTARTVEVIAILLAPADVDDFRVEMFGETTRLTWAPVTSLNLSHYEVRRSPLATGATWDASTPLETQVASGSVSLSVPTLLGSYLIKAIGVAAPDGARGESVNAAIVATIISGLNGFNAVESIDMSDDWNGTLTNVTVDAGVLSLATTETIADWTTLDSVIALAGGNRALAGTFTDGQTLDLGAVYTSRISTAISAVGVNYANTLDSWLVLTDIARLDGAGPSSWGAWIELRWTQDNPGGSPTWTNWVRIDSSDVTARAFQARLQLTSAQPKITPEVSSAVVTVDMPDRIESGNDIASLASGSTITFSPAFRALPAIVVTGQDLNTGDYLEITSKTAAGFTVRFFDATNTGVIRTFDYQARGYGYGA